MNLWADRMLFQAAVPVLFEKIAAAVPAAFIADRTRMMGGGLDFAEFVKAAPQMADQHRAHAALLQAQLADGRPFLLGEAPSLADFASYHPVWFLRSAPLTRAKLAGFDRTQTGRIASPASDTASAASARPTRRCASRATRSPRRRSPPDAGDPNGLRSGVRVRVLPDDYAFDPVVGELVASSVHEVALRRSAPEVGEVVVHFPRAGFRVQTA